MHAIYELHVSGVCHFVQTCCGASSDGNFLLAGSSGSQGQGAELTVSGCVAVYAGMAVVAIESCAKLTPCFHG